MWYLLSNWNDWASSSLTWNAAMSKHSSEWNGRALQSKFPSIGGWVSIGRLITSSGAISAVCLGHRVSSVLLDNGFALNVYPLATVVALGFTPSYFGPSTQSVRAYDNTQREVMGTLTIDLLICPTTFSTLFQVLRIPASFNLLLGRPWIHQVEAISSSLHQKVKFIHDGQVITI